MAGISRPRRLIRLKKVYGPDGKIPIGRSMFYEKFIATGKLRPVPLGERAVALVEDEVDAVIDEIIARRDA